MQKNEPKSNKVEVSGASHSVYVSRPKEKVEAMIEGSCNARSGEEG